MGNAYGRFTFTIGQPLAQDEATDVHAEVVIYYFHIREFYMKSC